MVGNVDIRSWELQPFSPKPCFVCVPPHGADVPLDHRITDYTLTTKCTRYCDIILSATRVAASRSNPSLLRNPLDPSQLLFFSGLTYAYESNVGPDDLLYTVITSTGASGGAASNVVFTDVPRRNQTVERWERLHGEDARAFRWGSAVYLLYNERLTYFPRMCMTQIVVSNADGSSSSSSSGGGGGGLPQVVALARNTTVHMRYEGSDEWRRNRGERAEKNWVPFEYNAVGGSPVLFFVYESLPHRIVELAPGPAVTIRKRRRVPVAQGGARKRPVQMVPDVSTFRLVRTAYLTNTSAADWPARWTTKYGEIRGGTPALRLPTATATATATTTSTTDTDDAYLTFFHSKRAHVHAKSVATYFMGAYLFSAAPPFAITHFSFEPLVHPSFYDNTTAGWAYRKLDYVVFPMSFEYSLDGAEVLLSYGRQDREGWLLRLSLPRLLASLMPVTTSRTLPVPVPAPAPVPS